MKQQTEDYQAMEYVYNLGNSAIENGFKPDETWELGLVTDAERSAIERKYYPTLATKVLPEGLGRLLTMIKERMHTLHIKFSSMPLPETAVLNQLQYVVAFNPARQRK